MANAKVIIINETEKEIMDISVKLTHRFGDIDPPQQVRSPKNH